MSSVSVRPTQNWILSPTGDFLFIVAAPAIALLWALSVLTSFGALAVLSIFAVFNTAHHLPTFIRIYGDKDLVRRFRWQLTIGPLFPFTIALGVVAFLLSRGLSVQHAFCLWVILVIWDPWHFIMQHYGFMRIYDRHNQAPPRLAARMDMMIAFSWFIFIMISAADWLPEILYDLTIQNSVPLLYFIDGEVLGWLRGTSFVVAVGATLVYAGYVIWCWASGSFVSWAKLLMVATTFGIMYLTYVPNSAMTAMIAGLRNTWPDVPDWNFRLGFATVGMVHVSQYLAIVWKYNRGLAKRPEGAREGAFKNLFVRGGIVIASAYVLLCLLYGFVMTDQVHPLLIDSNRPISEAPVLIQWVIGVLLAGLFTSTILHYYFDGFIWKVRHKENRQNLGIQGSPTDKPGGKSADGKPDQATASWWDSARLPVAKTVAWHALYFAVPMLFLLFSYVYFMSGPTAAPLKSLDRVLAIPPEQRDVGAKIQAIDALTIAEQRLALEQRMAELRPRSDHFAYSFELMQRMARVRDAYLPDQFDASDAQQLAQAAMVALENALEYGGPFEHMESEQPLTVEQLKQTLAAMRRDLAADTTDSGG